MEQTVCIVGERFKNVIADLVPKPGPVLLLYRQTFRIPGQISQGILTHTRQIKRNSTKDGIKAEKTSEKV